MKRIQIQLTNKKLDDVVQEMAEAATRSLQSRSIPPAEHTVAVKKAIRAVLEKYVHAYDLCGLATVCQEAQEVDAWDAPDAGKD